MNAVVIAPTGTAVQAATAADMKAQVQRIQQVMKAVMKDKVHFGIVPGTPKPSLWKPGAEVLCATFHIAPSYRADDLSDGDSIRYRVTCIGTHQGTGIVLGEGMGECSSNEEKYKWRKCTNREFEATDDTRRRLKYGYNSSTNQEYETRQVRTEPADIANTVLKMACKRAQIAMTLNVTAASDIFTQDLEDMPEDLRPDVDDAPTPQEQRPRGKPQTQAPRARASSNGGGSGSGNGRCTERQAGLVKVKLDHSGIPENEFFDKFGINKIDELPFNKVNDALAWIANPEQGREPGQDDEG